MTEDITISHAKLPFAIVHQGQQVSLQYSSGASVPVDHSYLVLGRLLEKVTELGIEPDVELTQDNLEEEVKHLVDKATATKKPRSKARK